ncbi:hypothetical protein ACTXT7_015866 [Hymenolepis weldensis]
MPEDEDVRHCVGIVNRLCTRFQFGFFIEDQFRCLIFSLGLRSPSYPGFNSDFFAACTMNPRLRSLVMDSNLLQDREPDSHFKDTDLAEYVPIIETAPSVNVTAGTATKMATKKASAENLLRANQRSLTRTTRQL